MIVVVLTTYDITPEQWAEFVKTTSVPPQGPNEKPIVPYVLVNSRSQQDLYTETEQISTTVKTEFGTSTWKEIKEAFVALTEPKSHKVHTMFFLMLDEQSTEDRRVVIMFKSHKWVNSKGEKRPPVFGGSPDLTPLTYWKRYRVPFEEAFETWALLDVHGGLETEPYLEGVVEEGPMSESESDSDY